jgi:hypothetical protein
LGNFPLDALPRGLVEPAGLYGQFRPAPLPFS